MSETNRTAPVSAPLDTQALVAERISCRECSGTGGVKMAGDCADCNGKGYFWEPAANAEYTDLYAALRAMNWNEGKLAVVEAKDLPLGVQTYSGDMLDEAIKACMENKHG